MVTLKRAVQVVEVEAATLLIHMKVRDQFYCAIQDSEGNQIGHDYSGYVPGFMPEEHYGDYLILKIDLDTGRITNWMPQSAEEIEALLEKSAQGEVW